jgi:hypothetical protein
LSIRFDPAALRRELTHLDEQDWVEHFVRQNYEGAWSILPLRAPAGAVHPIKMIYPDPGCATFVDTPLLARCGYFQQVLGTFQCPLQSARLMKLAPGSTIKLHTDHDLAPEHGTVRLHIPVTTNPDVDFRLNGTQVEMRRVNAGTCASATHASVVNRGRTDRVHLVLDALVNPWLLERLTDVVMIDPRIKSAAPSSSRPDSATPCNCSVLLVMAEHPVILPLLPTEPLSRTLERVRSYGDRVC